MGPKTQDEGSWGDLIDPENIHDYVYEDGEELE